MQLNSSGKRRATAADIVNFMNIWAMQAEPGHYKQTQEARALWRYLTALRGPDNKENDILKQTHTKLIRSPVHHLAKAGGALRLEPGGVNPNHMAAAHQKISKLLRLSFQNKEEQHLLYHIQGALEAMSYMEVPCPAPDVPGMLY